jgi:hypothetical protein
MPTGELPPVMNFWFTSVPLSLARPIVPLPFPSGTMFPQYR